MHNIFLVFALLSVAVTGQSDDMECIWCMNVVMNAEEHFGERIADVTDMEFVRYFHRECRLDRRKSSIYAAVCYEMFENHSTALFNDLRHNETVLKTCNDCNFCLSGSTV
ncbi:hypothetical protein V3C99_006035 [Haemonchus contortus]